MHHNQLRAETYKHYPESYLAIYALVVYSVSSIKREVCIIFYHETPERIFI
jgi:hypothetical protein